MSTPMIMTYATVCSGTEAFGHDLHEMGMESVFVSEIEPHASAVLREHYPHIPNYGDFTQIATPDGPRPAKPVRLLMGGTPCFVAGTLIVTARGLVPIEDVAVGDRVLTHRLFWQEVLQTGSKMANTVVLKGHGSSDIETTAEHPFYARRQTKTWNNDRRTYELGLQLPGWVEAKDMVGHFWGMPTQSGQSMAIPAPTPEGNERALPLLNANFWWVVGCWLGDGWTRVNTRRSYVLICGNPDNHADIAQNLSACGLHYSTSRTRTTVRYQVSSSVLAKWLRQYFGKGAAGKTMPSWAIYGLGETDRRALFLGYNYADGHVLHNGRGEENGLGFTTVSRALALGVRLLAATLGYSVAEHYCVNRRKVCTIEGRRVNERPSYHIRCHINSRSAVETDGILWQKTKNYRESNTAKSVYNLEVAGDNSYVADGFIVHNCQDFSIAGLRAGIAGDKGNLTLEFLLLLKRLGSRWVVWENVPGSFPALSHAAPAPVPPPAPLDVECDGQEMVTDQQYESDEHHAFNSFLAGLSELGYGVAYRTFDAQNFGVPSVAVASSLSAILETGVLPPQYYLSPKACLGILRRALSRRKTLPALLAHALQRVADWALTSSATEDSSPT